MSSIEKVINKLVVACEKDKLDVVKTLLGAGGNADIDVNQLGKDSDGGERTPLMAAAEKEHFQVVQYLIVQGQADPNIENSFGANALHYAARNTSKNTKVIELLLEHMTLDSINKKSRYGYTPVDLVYYNNSPLRQEIIALLRSKGGEANYYTYSDLNYSNNLRPDSYVPTLDVVHLRF